MKHPTKTLKFGLGQSHLALPTILVKFDALIFCSAKSLIMHPYASHKSLTNKVITRNQSFIIPMEKEMHVTKGVASLSHM